MSNFTVVTAPMVNVTVTNSVTSFASEKRFGKDLTVAALKTKLELISGVAWTSQIVEVYNKDGALVCRLDNNDALFGSYPVDDGMRLHVVDRGGQSINYEDVSQVPKYEISEADYSKRTDSVRAFKEKMKLGQFKEVDPEEQKRQEAEKQRQETLEKEKASSIIVGNRCEVRLSGQPPKRGTVMYVGLTDFKPGYWVGIKYDEPCGKHDGSVQGRRYFECPDKYGAFAKPQFVEVGDFPELSIDDELMEL